MKTGFGPTFTQRVPVLEKSRENCKTAAVIFNTKLWGSTGLSEIDFKAFWLFQLRAQRLFLSDLNPIIVYPCN